MTKYFVANIARYVLVDANSEEDARELGLAALRKLYDDPNREIVIHTIREATDSEIDLWDWHHKMTEKWTNK